VKVLPFAVLALDADIPAHHLAEPARDGQSQSSAAELRLVEESACVKDWNNLAICAAVMPIPVSRTRKLKFAG